MPGIEFVVWTYTPSAAQLSDKPGAMKGSFDSSNSIHAKMLLALESQAATSSRD